MTQREEIKRMWRDTFADVSPRWLSEVFDRFYRDSYARTITDAHGAIISSLLLTPYTLSFHGADVDIDYLSGAITLPQFRGLGSMRSLLHRSLADSYARGCMAVALIPAQDWLTFYYERAGGWSTVFYRHVDRYTSVHQFPTEGFAPAPADIPVDAVYDAYQEFCIAHSADYAVVLHSFADFRNILTDCRLDGGNLFVAAPVDDPRRVAAVAIAVPVNGVATVKMVEGINDAAREAVLEQVRQRYPGMGLAVHRPAADTQVGSIPARGLQECGMIRLVNAAMALDLVARDMPRTQPPVTIRVTDDIIPENNLTGRLLPSQGFQLLPSAEITPGIGVEITQTASRLDLDLHISTLARILFSAPRMGAIMGLPSLRPIMRLMLD